MLSACYPMRGQHKNTIFPNDSIATLTTLVFPGFFLVQCCCFSRVLPSKWCYHLYMFMPLSLSVFSSSLSNALCRCLFIHQQITRMYRKYLGPTAFDCEHNVLPRFSAIAPKLHLWFYHCVGINSDHSNVCHFACFASSFTQLAHDLWEPFPIHGISVFSRWNLNVCVFKNNKSMFSTDFWLETPEVWIHMAYLCLFTKKIDQHICVIE